MASEKDLNKGVVVQDHRDWDGYWRSNHLVNWSLELVDEISFRHRVFVRDSTSILLDHCRCSCIHFYIVIFRSKSVFVNL
jgi:hypothetical protein